ncbi:N-acetylglucosamine-6-phosphate deacetylase [Shimia haliotis]|uniref:N-acetylglucosamine 6-phosphate deacetylase n=1 Tax=Shimia haliotis TaxID=1280847 RepID=A0A1I4FRB5_9RHOB|nr:N-acetylglucosamine-6-phosphate deacetylase [Shimia haliotis]SFL19181.1 N-acetylglucosamine 6-phosphate deacetylase [Shimia haliotis]
MTSGMTTFRGGPIFDGEALHQGWAAQFDAGRLVAMGPEASVTGGHVVDLAGDILSPGYVDVQVNGGDGLMLNDAPTVATLARMAKAHRSLGCQTILPTLITDTPEKTRATIAAAVSAIEQGVAGIGGLHLEGPHLSVARKGAHDAALIRKMEDADLAELLSAADKLPALMVTVAPETVSVAQVQALHEAGIVVSLGHTDAPFDTCMDYFAAGATCATHLFNAMSQMGNREPGLVGAVLASGSVSAGLIADGVHVHPQSVRAAWDAKRGPGRIFLVSDAMAVAGTDLTGFELEGRHIARRDGQLTLEDGTLAGADLDLTTAIRVMVRDVGVSLEAALHAATAGPACVVGLDSVGRLREGVLISDVIRLGADLETVRSATA